MAGPAQVRRPVAEEAKVLREKAVEAAQAFKNYLIGGDPAQGKRFWSIYNSTFAASKITEQHVFMDRLFPELRKAVNDPLVKPLFEAFKKDRGRLFHFLWRNPVHYTDFIETVTKIRSALDRGAAKDNDVARLTELAKKTKDQELAVQESLVAKVREELKRAKGLDAAAFWKIYSDTKDRKNKEMVNALNEAVITVLERPSIKSAAEHHGDALTLELAKRMPKRQARLCVDALRSFLLSGDEKRYNEFERIINNNPFSGAFRSALTSEFRARITLDEASGLKAVMDAYKAWSRAQTGSTAMDPFKFAAMVKDLYKKALGGKPEDVETIRKQHGQEVVDALLEIVAKGLAGRAIRYFRDVVKTGNAGSERSFLALLNGEIATIEGGKVVMKMAEKNPIFWKAFVGIYTRELGTNRGLIELHRTFTSNILSIAVRDIFTEFAKPKPDMKRLKSDYGMTMLNLVSSNMAKLSWMARDASEIKTLIEKRSNAGDKSAEAFSRLKMRDKEGALVESYLALLSISTQVRSVEAAGVTDVIQKNLGGLSWISNTDAQGFEQELTRRAAARPADSAARELLSRLRSVANKRSTPTKTVTLSEVCLEAHDAYVKIADGRARLDALEKKHGKSFVALVEKRMPYLQWLVKPVEGITAEMQKRRTSQFVFSLHTGIGYSVDALSYAVKDIYRNLSSDRARLEKEYGTALVDFVKDNRANLAWAGGELSAIRQNLLAPTKDVAINNLKSGFLYRYTIAQFAPAIAEARRAVARKGIPEMDAHDAYGRVFMLPAVWHHVDKLPAIDKAVGERRDLIRRCNSLGRSLEALRRHVKRYRILQPAVVVIDDYITRWARTNAKIMLRANTIDKEALEALNKEWKELYSSIINTRDIKNTVELVFAAIHMAQTGGDIRTGTVTSSLLGSADRNTLTALIGWYNGEDKSGKQPIIRDMVSAIMKKASPRLHQFISGMSAVDYKFALDSVYAALKSKDAAKKKAAIDRFGQKFVDAITAQMEHLKLLESPSTDVKDLAMGQNRLYADIVLRCYYSLKRPKPGENREAMVDLFGEGFVQVVEQNLTALDSIAQAGAGIEELNKRLPAQLKTKLYLAYGEAYQKSVGRLEGMFSKEDALLADSMATIYKTLADKPPSDAPAGVRKEYENRLLKLKSGYGQLVPLVQRNWKDLWFLDSAKVTSEELKRLDASVLSQLRQAYKASDASKRPTFMANLVGMSTKLPEIYLTLRAALIFNNNTDEVGMKFKMAVDKYREVFGKDDYLIKQFINIDLLAQSYSLLRRRYAVDLPSGMKSLATADDLVRFLNSAQGKELLRKGKEFFTAMETNYNSWRTDNGITITTGEFSDQNITNIRNQLSIMDTLYLGVALEKFSTSSSMGRTAMVLTMESIITINNRDPYLVGPFLLQVLPAILKVAKDETALQLAIKAFNGTFSARYGEGTRDLAYSDAVNRKYFLEVFANIAKKLPVMATVFDHTQLADELRRTPEPTAAGGTGGTENPYLYRVKPGWWEPSQFGKDFSGAVGSYAKPLHLTPNIQLFPTGSLGAMQFTVDSGASELHERMRLQLTPPGRQTFRPTIPPQMRINTIGASTLLRRLNQLFGPMPKDYEAYWLSWDVNAAGYYEAEGGGTRKQSGGIAGTVAGRTTTGGIAGQVTYTGSGTVSEETTPAGTSKATTQTHAATIGMTAGGLPVVRMLKLDLQLDRSGSKTVSTPTGGEKTTVETPSAERAKGALESYIDIAKKKGVGMIVYLSGEYVPELKQKTTPPTGAEEPVTQEKKHELKSRLYFIDQYGNTYQLSYGKKTETELNNWLFGGVDHKNVLASFQFLGKQMLSDNGAAGGFNGAAVGFTIPTGGGETFSTLALGQLVRNLSTMTPVSAEQAVGAAVTRLLGSGKHRDVYAGFYRGSETVTTDPNDPTRITNTKTASTTAEVMWRRVSLSPGSYQFEIRAVGGYPATAGVSAKVEWTRGKTTHGAGLTAGYSTVDLLREFMMLDTAATNLYATSKNAFVGAHKWSENKARDMGYLIALNYMYSRLEDFVVRNPDGTYTTDKSAYKKEHFASALLMYWAKRHGLLMGAQKVPRWGESYKLIDQAMQQIQQNPENQAAILSGLATSLQGIFDKERWNFSLGYGYDGQKVGVYVFGGANISGDEQSYVNLKSVFVFGRPAKAWMEVGGYGYTYPKVIVAEDTTSGTFGITNKQTEFLDVTAGIGTTRWPAINAHLYQRHVTVSGTPDAFSALRDIYTTVGAGGDKQRLASSYGSRLVGLVEKDMGSMSWMVRPAEDIRKSLQAMKRRDSVVRNILLFLPGREIGAAKVTLDEAKTVREIYLALRTPDGRERMLKRYKRDLVQIISSNSSSLAWMMLPPDKMKAEFEKQATVKGSTAEKITKVAMRASATGSMLSGKEMQTLFQQNMVDVIFGCDSQAATKEGIQPQLYSVGLAKHLKTSKGRSKTFYVLHSVARLRPGTSASLIIGDHRDAREWIKSGKLIGSDIMRVTVAKVGDKYRLSFAGDKRLRYLSAWKIIGGVTVPLKPSELRYHDAAGNFTVGGLVKVMENHKFELLAGAIYGRRQYAQERWENWTVTFSGRLKTEQTSTLDESWYGYVFVNQLTKKAVFTSKDVFKNATEMREACSTLTDGRCDSFDKLSRTTGGIGITWSRMNVVTSKQQKFDFFFEAGSQTWTPASTALYAKRTEPVFRTGIGYGLTVTSASAVRPVQMYFGALGYKGLWNVGVGTEQPGVHAPNYLPTYIQSLRAIKGKTAWGVMFSVTAKW